MFIYSDPRTHANTSKVLRPKHLYSIIIRSYLLGNNRPITTKIKSVSGGCCLILVVRGQFVATFDKPTDQLNWYDWKQVFPPVLGRSYLYVTLRGFLLDQVFS